MSIPERSDGILVERRRGYTHVWNDQLPHDQNLSARAFGVWVYLTSRPDGWEVRVPHLVNVFREGRDALYAALGELVEVGYARREKFRDDKNLPRSRYVIITDIVQSIPIPGNPDPENPGEGIKERTTTTDDNQKTLGHIEDRSGFVILADDGEEDEGLSLAVPVNAVTRTVTPDRFNEFYETYPRHAKPLTARKAWDKAVKTTPPQVILDGLYANLPALLTREVSMRPYPATWLNAGSWADDPVAILSPSGDPWLDLERVDALTAMRGGGYTGIEPARHEETP